EHFGRNQRSAGETLAMRYGAAYIAIGTMALRGSFNAVEFVGDNMVVSRFALDDASPDDYAASLTAASRPRRLRPLRGPPPTRPRHSAPSVRRPTYCTSG